MDARHARSWAAVVTGLGMVLGAAAQGDTYYEVGPGQTYATVQAALIALPFVDADLNGQWDPFTQNQVINIHAGTYGISTAIDTDFNSKMNGKYSRTSLNNRIIIQANPGDQVVINETTPITQAINVRESHVTIQGIKFTGLSGNANGRYIEIGTGGYGTANQQRGGLIISNCEFVGAQPMWGNTSSSWNGDEPGVGFSFAVVRNYVRNIEEHYENPGKSLLPTAYLGNLYAGWGSVGGDSIFRPNVSTGYDKRFYVNNTLVSNTGSLTGGVRVSGSTNGANVTIANNIIYYGGPTANQAGLFFDAPCADSQWPTMGKNIEDGANLIWARTGTNYTTLASWQAYLALHGGADTGSYDGDPLFDNLAGGSYRLAFNSPGINAANTSYYTAAIADLGIGNLLGYRNYWTDPGLQFGVPVNIGAMIPEPGTLALLGLAGLCACRRSQRPPRANALHRG